ncbi:hypothetical protein T484DRAFT_1799973 [Baffinella frigidus]|nr:hypothetical protein T484DRAFT_1799973 [Cryptophyta sp. CCMP2293]
MRRACYATHETITANGDVCRGLWALWWSCCAMRRACYATHETVTANGDVCRGLWSAVSLKGTRCGDGHSLISGLGSERMAAMLPSSLEGLGPERMGAMLHLNLAGVSTVTDDTLAVVAEQCGALEHLIADRRVDVGPQITDTGIVDIAAKCPNLKSLSIAWCSEVTDVGVKAVAECCPLVEALDLSFCHALSDAGLLALLDNCEALTSLRLEACDRITEQAVVAVAQAAPNLKTISLAGCSPEPQDDLPRRMH